jgi:hypothetical protein
MQYASPSLRPTNTIVPRRSLAQSHSVDRRVAKNLEQ